MTLGSYFHRLLASYVRVSVRPDDRVVLVDPDDVFRDRFPRGDIVRVCTSKSPDGFAGVREWRPDYVVLNGTVHYTSDIQALLERLHTEVCQPSTRVLIIFYSTLWSPVLRLAIKLGLRRTQPEANWVAPEDVVNLVLLSDFEVVRTESRVLCPIWLPLVSGFANTYLSQFPVARLFNLLNIVVVRPVGPTALPERPSVSVVVPARNEEGNIENIIARVPRMGPDDELIFIEGHSTDGTWAAINRAQQAHAGDRQVVVARQDGIGKGDAVRKGFGLASKDILMILDADLTVKPEDLPRFYEALVSGKGEFINGSRLVYVMQDEAMQFFNVLGNKFFAFAFSFVLGQRFKDTLCGTKVLSRADYLKIAAHRSYFGDFDPFGDFDLIFGASRLGLKIVEIPIAYQRRVYGTTNISRWRHGVILFRMLMFAAGRLRFL